MCFRFLAELPGFYTSSSRGYRILFQCEFKNQTLKNNLNLYKLQTKFPSGFIFIHDTFYIDYSKLNSIDISEFDSHLKDLYIRNNFRPIREFMQRKHKDFGEYFVKDMANSKIIDLQLRLGQPYLYFHQGKCEHL